MPETPYHGSAQYLRLRTAQVGSTPAGSWVELTGEGNGVSNIKVMGGRGDARDRPGTGSNLYRDVLGKKRWELSFDMDLNSLSEAFIDKEGTLYDMEYGRRGNASSAPKESGQCVLASVDPNTPTDDVGTMSLSFPGSGPKTLGTF